MIIWKWVLIMLVWVVNYNVNASEHCVLSLILKWIKKKQQRQGDFSLNFINHKIEVPVPTIFFVWAGDYHVSQPFWIISIYSFVWLAHGKLPVKYIQLDLKLLLLLLWRSNFRTLKNIVSFGHVFNSVKSSLKPGTQFERNGNVWYREAPNSPRACFKTSIQLERNRNKS